MKAKSVINETTDKIVLAGWFGESRAAEMSAELANIEQSQMFQQWIAALDQSEEANAAPHITVAALTSGYCEDLAAYLYYKYGATVVDLDTPSLPPKFGHYFSRLDGKFYDALNPQGAARPSEMVYFKQAMEQYPHLTPQAVDRHLSAAWNDKPDYYDTVAKEFFGELDQAADELGRRLGEAGEAVEVHSRGTPKYGLVDDHHDRVGKAEKSARALRINNFSAAHDDVYVFSNASAGQMLDVCAKWLVLAVPYGGYYIAGDRLVSREEMDELRDLSGDLEQRMNESLETDRAGDTVTYPLARQGEMQAFAGDVDWKGKIIYMPVDKFLRLASPIDRTLPSVEKNVKRLIHQIVTGQRLDPCTLIVDKNVVVAHEGRHRAFAARDLGIEKIPVLIIPRDYPRVPKWKSHHHRAVELADFSPEHIDAVDPNDTGPLGTDRSVINSRTGQRDWARLMKSLAGD